MADITVGHDPKVADWLLEPGGKEKNFHAMVSSLHICLYFVEECDHQRSVVYSTLLS
jgi:hypothetical protein